MCRFALGEVHSPDSPHFNGRALCGAVLLNGPNGCQPLPACCQSAALGDSMTRVGGELWSWGGDAMRSAFYGYFAEMLRKPTG